MEKEFDRSKIPDVIIDPELEKYRGQILFPEQHARVKEMLKTANFPEEVKERLRQFKNKPTSCC